MNSDWTHHADSASLRRSPSWPAPSESDENYGLTLSTRSDNARQGEVQAEPARQVLSLVLHRGGHRLGEGNVLVDRVHPQHTGLAVGGGVELADQPVLVQDWQRPVAPAALGGRL